jgi:hypothetical protein
MQYRRLFSQWIHDQGIMSAIKTFLGTRLQRITPKFHKVEALDIVHGEQVADQSDKNAA